MLIILAHYGPKGHPMGLTVQCSGAPCRPWAKEGDNSALLAWRKWKARKFPPLMACVHSVFPPAKQGRVVPLLWPRGCRAPHWCQAFSVLKWGIYFLDMTFCIATYYSINFCSLKENHLYICPEQPILNMIIQLVYNTQFVCVHWSHLIVPYILWAHFPN